MILELLQILGGCILCFGYIPQILHIFKTKKVEGLKLSTFLMFTLGIALMEIYAISLLIQGVAIPFFITNTLSIVLLIILCNLIIIYQRRANGKSNYFRNIKFFSFIYRIFS